MSFTEKSAFERWWRNQWSFGCLDIDDPSKTMFGAAKKDVAYIWQEGWKARASLPPQPADSDLTFRLPDSAIHGIKFLKPPQPVEGSAERMTDEQLQMEVRRKIKAALEEANEDDDLDATVTVYLAIHPYLTSNHDNTGKENTE